jgi:hypothetical protein
MVKKWGSSVREAFWGGDVEGGVEMNVRTMYRTVSWADHAPAGFSLPLPDPVIPVYVHPGL